MDEIDVLVNVASMLTQDILAEGSQNALLQTFHKNITSQQQSQHSNTQDSDDDIDLFVYNQLIKKRKIVNENKNKEDAESTDSIQNYPFVTFLKDCSDLTFETQFKFTKATFMVK